MAPGSRLQELTAKYMQNPRRFFVPLANEYRKTNDLDRAIALCREHLSSQPGHMSGHIVLGRAYYEKGDIDAAREVFITSVELDDENVIALRHLGDIARSRSQVAEARQWYARVLDADPQNAEIERLLRSLGPAEGEIVAGPEATGERTVTPVAQAGSPGTEAAGGDLTPEWADARASTPTLPSDHAAEVASALAEPTPPGLRAIVAPEAAEEGNDLRRAGSELSDLPAVPRIPLDRFDLSTLAAAPESAAPATPVEGDQDILVDDGVGFIFDDLDELVDPSATTGAGMSLPPVHEADFSAGISTPAAHAPAVPADPMIPPPASAAGAAPSAEEQPAADDLLSRPGFGALASFASWRSAQERETPTHVPAQPAPVESASRPAAEPAGLFWESGTGDTTSTAPEFVTETMAALYARQGFHQQALDVYQTLLARSPGDVALTAKVAELRAAVEAQRGTVARAEKSLEEDADNALQFEDLDARGSSAAGPPSMLESMYEVSPPTSGDAMGDAFAEAWEGTPDGDDDWFAESASPDLAIDGGLAGDEMFGVSVELFGSAPQPAAGTASGSAPAGGGVATLEAVFGSPVIGAADDGAAGMLLALATQMVGRLPKEAPTLPVPDVLELPNAVAGDEVTGASPAPLLSFDRFFSGAGAPPRPRIDTPAARPSVTPTWPAPAAAPAPSLSPTFGGVPVIPPPPATSAAWAGFDQFVPPAAPPATSNVAPIPPRERPVAPPPTPPAFVTPSAPTAPVSAADSVEPETSALPFLDIDEPSGPPHVVVPPMMADLEQGTPRAYTPPVVDVVPPPAHRPVEARTSTESGAVEEPPVTPPVAEAPREAPSDFHRWLEGLS